jgi:hypothetical protein
MGEKIKLKRSICISALGKYKGEDRLTQSDIKQAKKELLQRT